MNTEHDTDALYAHSRQRVWGVNQPVTPIITTAGYDISSLGGENVLRWLKYRCIRKEAKRNALALIYTLDDDDDWTKPEALIKANPNYVVCR